MFNEMTQNEAIVDAVLVLPRLRIQNANAISSAMTWGFPAISAFTGLMTALDRRMGPGSGLNFHGVGVLCHDFEPQVTTDGYEYEFILTRNPLLKDGSVATIIEEGRAHLDVTLVFDVQLALSQSGENERAALAEKIGETMHGMRVAGGSVVPALPGKFRSPPRPQLVVLSDDHDKRKDQFRRLSRRWMPGSALVSRDDLLQSRWESLKETQPDATLFDAWLDLSRLNHHATRQVELNEESGESQETVEWTRTSRSGWTVPIPVGFAALNDLNPAGTVKNARDPNVPFQFVECIYSMGEWVSPHRFNSLDDLIWRPQYDKASGLYRCVNDYRAPPLSVPVSSNN